MIFTDKNGFCREKPNLVTCLDEITSQPTSSVCTSSSFKTLALSARRDVVLCALLHSLCAKFVQYGGSDAQRDVQVDHTTVRRWALKILPVLAKLFRCRRHSVGQN